MMNQQQPNHLKILYLADDVISQVTNKLETDSTIPLLIGK